MSSDSIKLGDFKVDEDVVREAPDEAPTSFDVDEVVEADEKQTEEIFDEELEEEARQRLVETYFPLPEDFPSKEELEAMSSQFGKIRIHRMAPGEAYVVRPLTRPEYRTYLNIMRDKYKSAEEATTPDARMDQEEMMVERCLIYPKVTTEQIKGASSKLHKIALAGTISILAYDIEEISNLVESSIGPFEEM